MTPPPSDEPTPSGHWTWLAVWTVAAYPWHRAAFIALNVGLTLANVWTGAPWWAVWPLLITGLPFMVHYLALRTLLADDAWADERAERIHARSYDRGHVESILNAWAEARRRRRQPPPRD